MLPSLRGAPCKNASDHEFMSIKSTAITKNAGLQVTNFFLCRNGWDEGIIR